ncbi:MAG: glycerol-3-phosphate 1-O-acyltransferase PlsY [Rhodospirillales bacterium]|nr:glycerol-3-phosphate 1-O-acyltransferase PlsY [Rhodospirillales bacterium]MCB9996742.1 glycerol-3-phosphate 1-O-acyltransferase PlsY [Rhodospirillales bacterium]
MIELSAILFGYLLGSIPFGLVLAKLSGYGDIRQIGSGNIGATNVLRTGNKKLAALTLFLDGSKGAVAVFITYYIVSSMYDCSVMGACPPENPCLCFTPPEIRTISFIAGFAAICGHLFPVWLKFKGGKGVATTLGMLLAAAPLVGIGACVIWLLTAVIFRYSSLSALVAIFAAPPLAHFIYADPSLTGVCGVITVLVWFKHRSNIQRLVKGEEPKIGKKK